MRSFLAACARNWYWFVISVIACGCLAFLYGKTQTQVYSSDAYILVNTEDSQTNGSQSHVFSDLGVSTGVNGIPDEMFKLRSTKLMESVVAHLGLNVQYYGHVYLRDVNIYKSAPVQVTPLNDIHEDFTVTVQPKSETEFEFQINGGQWKKAHFGNKVNTVYGPVAITKTKNFTKTDNLAECLTIVRIYTTRSIAKRLVANLSAEKADKASNVVHLSLTCDNHDLSLDVLNALIVAYNQEAISDKNRVARSTENFIADRIESLSKDLSGVDSRIAELKVAGAGATMFADPSTGVKYVENVSDADMQLRLATYIRDHLASMHGTDLIPSNTGIENSGIETQINQYNEAMLRYQKIAATSSKENPVMVELSNSLNAMKGNIMRTINSYIRTLSMKQSRAVTESNRAIGGMQAVPSQEKAITEVTRQQKIKEQLYLYLLNKREENALQLAITEPNAKVVENASGASMPIAPNEMKIMLLGLLAGFCLPAFVIFCIFWIYSLDTTVHSRHEIEDNCDIPIIGELPAKSRDQSKKEIVVTEDGRDRITEAFRIIRSNLDYMVTPCKDHGVVMQLTSTMAGEGKSFIAINLALVCAHIGKKVIAVDVDLRKGRFSEYIGVENTGVGLSAYLSGAVDDIHSVITRGVLYDNLDFISIGAIPPNPTNLLMSDRFSQMIETLKSEYDYVLLDTVPFGIIADASLINRYADLTIYIVRDGRLDRRYLEELDKMSKDQKIKNLTMLLSVIG